MRDLFWIINNCGFGSTTMCTHIYVWRKGLAVTSAEGRAEGLAHGEGRVPALPLGHHGRDGLFLKPRSGPWPGVT